MKNLSTLIPHEQLIEVLQRFLHEYIIDGRIAGISIETIVDLVRLYLENQYMLYENKIYQQIRGSYFNSLLASILMNISMYYWEQDLVRYLDKKNEIFSRSISSKKFRGVLLLFNLSLSSVTKVDFSVHRMSMKSVSSRFPCSILSNNGFRSDFLTSIHRTKAMVTSIVIQKIHFIQLLLLYRPIAHQKKFHETFHIGPSI